MKKNRITTSIVALAVVAGLAAWAGLRAASPALADSPDAIRPLAVGKTAPTPTLKTADGKGFDLAAAFQQKPTVLVFYKAGWCGLGAKNLAQLTEGQSKFDTLGYQIIAISTDKPEDLTPTRLKHGLAYTLLSDSAITASSAYGVAYRASQELIDSYAAKQIALAPVEGEKGNRWLLVPTVFIVGKDGAIKWVHSNQKENPTLNDLVAAAEAGLK